MTGWFQGMQVYRKRNAATESVWEGKRMDIKIADGYEKLPDRTKEQLAGGNVFFSRNYEGYISRLNQKEVYLYNDCYIVPVTIYTKYMFQYAALPSEPLELSTGNGQELKEFLEQAVLCLETQLKIGWVITNAAAFFTAYPKNSLRIPFGSHVIDLRQDEEQIWSHIHSKHRNSIRRAEKSGVIVKHGGRELLEDYVSIDRETWERSSKKALGRSFFEDMVEGLKENVILFIAYKEEKPQSGAIFYYSSPMSYYMYGASVNHPEPGATNFLHWKAIQYMKMKQVKEYSFVGCRIGEDEDSKFHNIQRFKARFGGELKQVYLFKVIINARKYQLFKSLYQWKNKTEMTDAIDEEISKWRELNE